MSQTTHPLYEDMVDLDTVAKWRNTGFNRVKVDLLLGDLPQYEIPSFPGRKFIFRHHLRRVQSQDPRFRTMEPLPNYSGRSNGDVNGQKDDAHMLYLREAICRGASPAEISEIRLKAEAKYTAKITNDLIEMFVAEAQIPETTRASIQKNLAMRAPTVIDAIPGSDYRPMPNWRDDFDLEIDETDAAFYALFPDRKTSVKIQEPVRRAPEHMKLRKEQLKPHSTQIHFDPTWAKKLRDNWNPLSTGTLIVLDKDLDGLYPVIDGGHRHDAAPDDYEFDCKVHFGLTAKEVGQLWFDSNINRKKKPVVARHANLLLMEDPTAVLINRLVTGIDRPVTTRGSKEDRFSCPDALEGMIKKRGAEIVERMFPLIGKLCQGHPCPTPFVRAFIELEWMVNEHARRQNSNAVVSLTDTRWSNRILDIGYDIFEKEMRVQVGSFSGNRETKWAQVILERINHGLKKDRLVATVIIGE